MLQLVGLIDENKTIIGLKFIEIIRYWDLAADENKTIIGLKFKNLGSGYLGQHDENKTIIGLKYITSYVNFCCKD